MIRSEMLERMSAVEYFEWMALDYKEPDGSTAPQHRQQTGEEMIAVLKAFSPRPKAQHAGNQRRRA